MHTTTLYLKEEKKHSVRYDAKSDDEEAGMTSIYVSKSILPAPYPKVIRVMVDVPSQAS